MSNDAPSTDPRSNFAISTMPSFSADVEYYATKQVALYITNISGSDQLVERLTIQLQTERGASPIYLDQDCGVRIARNKAAEIAIIVRPTPLYREGTNFFGVMIHYRSFRQTRLDPVRMDEPHSNCSYLILKPPPITLGGVFISFKQPENLVYAEALHRYARRAGFQPYIVKNDPRPGTDQWERIEQAIEQSHTALIVWTSRTTWGTGVEKEIELCRKHKVQEILLIEGDEPLPALYRDTTIEYIHFDPTDPGVKFCEAINSLREQMLRPEGSV